MVTVVDTATALVFTGKVALVAPAGTATLEGTLAAPLLLESATCAPPAGAGALNVTVPVEDCRPPITLVGFSVSEADLVTPPQDAEMATVADAVTALVFTGNVAPVAPAGTATLEGTLAAPLLLESATCAPPAGAGPLNVTVPVEEFPAVTLLGFSESDERETDAVAEEDSSKSRTAGLGSFCETATNF